MRAILKTVGQLFAIVFGLVALAIGATIYQSYAFSAHWEKRFLAGSKAVAGLPAVDLSVGLPGETPAPPPVDDAKLVRKVFPDGSWFIVAQHDTHDGGEWDQAVFFDSRGRIKKTSRHFCGWEGLLGALSDSARNAKSVEEFYGAAGLEPPSS